MCVCVCAVMVCGVCVCVLCVCVCVCVCGVCHILCEIYSVRVCVLEYMVYEHKCV